MCGICGFSWEDKALVRKMCRSIAHRGPDQEGIYTDKNMSLGHRRLSIIDLSTRGKQPMCNVDGSIWIVFNGEIYNFLKLRESLEKKGHKFQSQTDTEVILHLYEEKGTDCCSFLNGIFAFAIYDSRNKDLLLARDRAGVKPLYYYIQDGKIVFGSEIKAILQHNIPRRINQDSLSKFLTFTYMPDTASMFEGISQVAPGGFLAFRNGKVSFEKYWSFDIQPDSRNIEHYSGSLKDCFQQVVERQLVSDVPLGAFLSGGLDSSSIVAFMSRATDKPVRTFSVGYNDSIDELKDARIIADEFGTDHKEILLEPKTIEYLPALLRHLDEPMADPVNLPTYLMSKEAKKRVSVVLSGEGADELFGGYSWYRRAMQVQAIRKMPTLMQKATGALSKLCPVEKIKRRMEFIGNADEGGRSYISFNSVFTRDECSMLCESYKDPAGSLSRFFSGKKPYIDQVYECDFNTYLPGQILTKTDRMSMAHALEVRVPFLDNEMITIGSQIPSAYKMQGSSTKMVLRKAMKDILPVHTLEKRKQGFSVPLNTWIRHDLREYADNILNDMHNKDLDTEYVRRIVRQAKDEKKSHKIDKVWNLLSFELWFRMYIENEDSNLPSGN